MRDFRKKLIINTPYVGNSGGIANFYANIQKKLSQRTELNFITHPNDKSPKVFGYLLIYWKFVVLLLNRPQASVLLNPSFRIKAVLRDVVFVLLSRLIGRKVYIFWHGWDSNLKAKICKEKTIKWLLKYVLNKVEKHLVLAQKFSLDLKNIGVEKNINIFKTCIHERYIDYVASRDMELFEKRSQKTLLFVSRIEKYKGIYELIKAFRILKKEFTDLKLIIAGNGSEEQRVRDVVKSLGLMDVEFKGYVKGDDKIDLFMNSDLFVLPSYSEGMPLSVLEAMNFGLYIVTTPVGSLKEIIGPENGVLVKERSAQSIVDGIKKAYSNSSMIEVSRENILNVREHFAPGKVANELEKLILGNNP